MHTHTCTRKHARARMHAHAHTHTLISVIFKKPDTLVGAPSLIIKNHPNILTVGINVKIMSSENMYILL